MFNSVFFVDNVNRLRCQEMKEIRDALPNEPQPQGLVSETNELPSQTATEAPSQGATEVHPPAAPVEAPELRRSLRVCRVPKHLEDYVLV